MICGREDCCCSAKEKEQETDCDAEDRREEADGLTPGTPWASSSNLSTVSSSNWSTSTQASSDTHVGRRTPSPAHGPGYDRHEIEGIGGVVKKKRVRMVRVGACVPVWNPKRPAARFWGRRLTAAPGAGADGV